MDVEPCLSVVDGLFDHCGGGHDGVDPAGYQHAALHQTFTGHSVIVSADAAGGLARGGLCGLKPCWDFSSVCLSVSA